MNWGYKLFFTFVVFASLMSFLVYKALHTDFQLVEKDYYKSELRYQEIIDGSNRVNQLASQVVVSQDKENTIIQLPAEMSGKKVSGRIWFYCPYDAKKDRKLDLNPGQDARQSYSIADITPGRYIVKVQWKLANEDYYSEQTITVD